MTVSLESEASKDYFVKGIQWLWPDPDTFFNVATLYLKHMPTTLFSVR